MLIHHSAANLQRCKIKNKKASMNGSVVHNHPRSANTSTRRGGKAALKNVPSIYAYCTDGLISTTVQGKCDEMGFFHG